MRKAILPTPFSRGWARNKADFVGILLKELAEATDGELLGDPGLAVSGASSLTAATGADIVYIESPKYFSLLADCKAGVIVLSAEILQRLRSDGVIDDQQDQRDIGLPGDEVEAALPVGRPPPLSLGRDPKHRVRAGGDLVDDVVHAVLPSHRAIDGEPPEVPEPRRHQKTSPPVFEL
ncbi:MAG: hypothetical protein DSZ33_02150, partial [Gammaproteobacteria bacterium]